MKSKQYIHFISKTGIILLFLSIVVWSGCKSSKETEANVVALEKVSKEERLNRIIQSGINYNTISSNLKFTVKGGNKSKEVSVDAQLRIRKNEVIQLSLRVPILGTEAFKVLITPDKVIIIDRINKQYLEESMQSIKMKVPLDFDYYSLEAMLTNQLFIAGKKEVTARDFNSFRVMENDYEVKISNTDRQNIQYAFTSNYTNRIQETQMSQERLKANLLCDYTDWGLTSNKKDFPMLMKFSLSIPDKSYNVNLAFRSVDVNSTFNVDYRIPDKYKQITLQQVINLMKKLL
ncbi:MAG: DUF4292 domain-containing protein [Bacteroidales bacterium]|nr:DUF4292 domain-containing protein [Bacteroidales bacterium]